MKDRRMKDRRMKDRRMKDRRMKDRREGAPPTRIRLSWSSLWEARPAAIF
jgi:hypothetical protein